MPILERQRQRIFYEVSGSGPAVVLGHSLLCSGEMWEGQVPALAESYRVVNIDYRGHGKSGTVERDFTLYDLVDDTVAILDEQGINRAAWVGLSIGGMISLRAALTVPERVGALIVAGASAAAEPFYPRFKYRVLGLGARLVGMRPFVSPIEAIMFGQSTLQGNRPLVDEWIPSVLSMDLPSILRCLEATVTRDSLLHRLQEIEVPTLVFAGEEDRAQPVSMSEEIANGIFGSRLEIIPGAGHLSSLEQPELVTRAMLDFLAGLDLTEH